MNEFALSTNRNKRKQNVFFIAILYCLHNTFSNTSYNLKKNACVLPAAHEPV